jgi:RNA polymerase sigma-70 factor (ECF subfamily)
MKMLDNAQDAEDILQETFIKAYRHLGDFDGRSSPATWLYRIATNEALMSLRKKHPELISLEEPVDSGIEPQEPMQILDWCCMPEEDYLTAEGLAALDQAVDLLPASLRIVFILRDIQGLSTKETAEVLDLSETAVKTRLSRARLRLRDSLTVYYGEVLKER